MRNEKGDSDAAVGDDVVVIYRRVVVVDNKQNLVEDNKGTRTMFYGCFGNLKRFLKRHVAQQL